MGLKGHGRKVSEKNKTSVGTRVKKTVDQKRQISVTKKQKGGEDEKDDAKIQ